MPNTVRLHRVLATSPEKVYRAFLEVLIPEQAAPLFRNDGAPPVPINCRPAFRSILAPHSGMMSPGGEG
jgi:hypothetical protein